ncbi:MAG: S41 family peptidase [Saprospiraceae bacterium]|nr:S41 family peptidase [Saprospiraceae bacterium]
MKRCIILIYTYCLLTITSQLNAQYTENTVTLQKQEEVVQKICLLLNENYIFPEKAQEMSDLISGKLRQKAYENVTDPMQFASQLTSDLQSISHDLHINVRFDPSMVQEIRMSHTSEDSLNFIKLMDSRESRENYGFEEIKILSDGVGYLKLNGFSGSKNAGEAAASAMNFLSRSEALIIDLRQNGGGSPDMIQILSSYLFDQGLVHLNDFYYRPSDDIQQRWTLPYVPGKKMPTTDVYILTSRRTFSAAEEFTYNLKNLNRATIIGETTGGGAHPGEFMAASDEFGIFVPNGRAINPITKTNWEGMGVMPHIQIPADQALTEAHFRAVEKLANKYQDNPENPYSWTSDQLKAAAHPFELNLEEAKEYVGNFGARTIRLKDGKLLYQRDIGPEYPLVGMEKDLFMVENIPYFRLQFVREQGKIVAVEGIYDNGRHDKNMKLVNP